MRFEFATATRIIFGEGAAHQVAPIAAAFGKRALIVIDPHVERASGLIAEMQARDIAVTTFAVSGEPSVEMILAGVERARASLGDFVVGLGGGSAIDTGKTIAALLTNPGDPRDYLEVVGKGQTLTQLAAPLIAIPTTAGTGSEVTRNAVLSVPEKRVKVSLRSALMLPRVAIVDPELTYSVPPDVTASTGLDALTQLIEPYTCAAPNPMVDALCIEGIPRVARSLVRAYRDGNDAEARADMALASLFGGLALANAKLGAAHGFAGVLGGMYAAPHGALCARLLPFAMETNLRALRERAADSSVLARYDRVAQLVTGAANARADDGVARLRALCAELRSAPLSHFGIARADFPIIIAQAQKASSMQGNPIALTEAELEQVLEQAL
ncbi:MAG: iron-containing alcohol dehydrogenase [Chloroflexota bacterium]